MAIKVNKDVFKALENAKYNLDAGNEKLIGFRLTKSFNLGRTILNDLDFDIFVRCLYEGYELEEGPEEKTINKFKENVAKSYTTSAVESQFFRGFNEGIYFVIKTFGIKLENFK